MTQYLENVREIERRIQRAEKSQGDEDCSCRRDRPAFRSYEEHIRLMYDLMALAYQAERHARHHVHGVARGQQPHLSAGRRHRRPSRDLAPPEPAEKMEKNVKIQTYNIGLFGTSSRS